MRQSESVRVRRRRLVGSSQKMDLPANVARRFSAFRTTNRQSPNHQLAAFGIFSRLTTLPVVHIMATRSGDRSIPGRDGPRWDAIRGQLGGSSTPAEMVVRSLDTTYSLSVQEHLSRDRTTREREVDQATHVVASNRTIESGQRCQPRGYRRSGTE